MRRLYFAAFILAALSIQGCGYQLRGQLPAVSGLGNVHVRSADTALGDQVRAQLEAAGAQLAASGSGASSILTVRVPQYRRQVATVDARGRATAYRLIYTASFSLTKATGETLLDEQRVRVQRDYEFDSTAVLVSEGEEDVLRRDLERDTAERIVRRLASVGR